MKTTFLITVDAESRGRGNPGQDILGQLPGRPETYGIDHMMDLLEAHHARATFFLNVYEVAKHGDEVIARAARSIHSRGHDLELHTHPRPMYPHYGMSHAPFKDQVAILEKGIGLIEGWTGKRTVAHRAGAFLANGDTLRAVATAGLAADCSLAPGSNDVVPLVEELGSSNHARRVGSVWEIPVTFYEQLRVGPWCSRRMLDIEASSLAEIKRVTRIAIAQKLPTVCLLMHSFSFTRTGRPDKRVILRFSRLLDWLRQQDDIEIGTVEQCCRYLSERSISVSASAPPARTGAWLMWGRALQSWNAGWKNFMVASGGILCLTISALVLVYLGYALLRR